MIPLLCKWTADQHGLGAENTVECDASQRCENKQQFYFQKPTWLDKKREGPFVGVDDALRRSWEATALS